MVAAGRSIVARAAAGSIPVRLLGGVAIWIRGSPAARALLGRDYADIDLVAHKRQSRALRALLEEAGFEPERVFNATHGARRLLYRGPGGWQVNIFLDTFEMSHTLDLGARLEAEPETLAAAELLLTKLQVAEVNAKDLSDAAMLLWDHEPAAADGPGLLNVARMAAACGAQLGPVHHRHRQPRGLPRPARRPGPGRARPRAHRPPDRRRHPGADGGAQDGGLAAAGQGGAPEALVPGSRGGDPVSMRVYFATDIHGSEVCWRKFLNAGRFYGADTLIMGGDVSGKAVVPVVCLPGGGYLVRQFSGGKVLAPAELDQAEARIRDMGFYPYRTTDEELDETWDSPRAVEAVFLSLMRETLGRWLDLARERLAGTGIRLYIMCGNDDPPELREILRASDAVTETEERLIDLGEGITMISFGWSNRTPWHTPREMDEDEMERRIEKMATEVTRPERAVFNLHVPPARTAIDLAPALDDSLKPRVRGGAVVMEPVGSEAVRRMLERHQPMLGLHGHIHESRGAVRLGRTLSINPGSEYGDGILRGALIDLDGRKGIRNYQLPVG